MEQPSPLAAPTTEHFRRVREVFESALQHPPDVRARFVEQAAGGDTVVISEVHRMLAADAHGYALLDEGNFGETRIHVGSVFAGHFDIIGVLGRGGMGEVYHALDKELQRTVALKLLPSAFSRDANRLSRFRREAQVLASLNHSNIGAIYSFEESDGVQALALELIQGPTLADRIAQGPIPLDEAVPIARQIAEALEAAHEQGIVHRDLKPANVKLRPDGVVKVLDFGLAKATHLPETGHTQGPDSPEVTSPAMLATGLIIGTPAYMAPEQARGRPADKRADIWAFGAVLYEMLSGRRAFRGEDISDTLASVLRQEVDWTALPASIPVAVRNLLARCLERDPNQRLRDIGEARVLLENPARLIPPVGPASDTQWRLAPLILTALGSGLLVSGFVLFFNLASSNQTQVARLSLNLPEEQPLFINRNTMAISSDGSQIVFAKPYGLHLRSLAEAETKIIRGTETFFNITEPAFSPDGRFIAFHAGSDRTLKRIPTTGGAALTICKALAPSSVTWGKEGIVYTSMSFEPSRWSVRFDRATASYFDTILMVQPEGGSPQTLVKVGKGEIVHRPQFLPGGNSLMYTLADASNPNAWDNARIVATNLKTGERTTVREGASDARYLPTGHLVYAVSGSLIAVAFDPGSLKTTGSAVPIISGVMRADPDSTGGAHYSFAENGTLIYLPGPIAPRWDLAIADRQGEIHPLHLPSHPYESPRVSPDGTQVAMHSTEGNQSTIYVLDRSDGSALRRLTFEGNNWLPVWTSDGKRVAFQSDRQGDRAIFWQRADGTGSAERLTKPEPGETHEPEAWSRTRDTLLFTVTKDDKVTLWALSMRTRKAMPFGNVHSSTPTGAVLSPDDKWVAYATTEGVTTTIYVQPFPPTGVQYELLREGAEKPNHPVWSPDGTELYFNPGPAQFKSVRVTTRPNFAFGSAVSLPRPFRAAHLLKPRPYDVLPDGKFIASISPSQSGSERPGSPRVNVVLNWFADLRARVPVSR